MSSTTNSLIPPTSIVSSSTPFFSTNPSATASNNGSPGAASSSLYLFTFLATLLLLLAVSCAIVVRSLIIRRRFRRRVEEALAAGIILPQQGMKRRDFGERPKLWDSWLSLGDDDSWRNLKPVAAKIISDKYAGNGQPRKPLLPPLRSVSPDSQEQQPRRRRLLGRMLRSGRSSSPPPSDDLATSASHTSDSHLDDVELQVSVVIAMPSQYRPHAWDSNALQRKLRGIESNSEHDDEDLPDLVFGVTEVPWKVPAVNDNT